jgi:steroid delta-isomerase-like uncharacterized protein
MAETKTEAGAQAEPAVEAKPTRRRITRRKAVEERARSYFDALARRDPEAMADHWREDGVGDFVPIRVMRGRDELTAFFREIFAAVPDVEFTVTRVVAGERIAAVEWRMRANFTGASFQGVEPTGKPIELRGVDLLELEDGQIVSNTSYYDGAAYARQVGLMPPEGSGAERAMKSAFNAVTKLRRAVGERTGAGEGTSA